MPTDKIKQVLKRIDVGIENFVKDLPDSEKKIYDKVMTIVKQLELDVLGNISNNVNNLKLVTTLNKEINKLVLNNEYLKKVSEFTGIYDDISKLNNEYLSTTFDKFKPSKVLPKIKDASIDITIDQLTENGVAEAFSNEIKTLLTDNIKSGSSYADMIEKLSNSIKGNDKVDGGLTRYSKQIAVDSVHQYNATYTKQISSDLGSEFFVYSGSNIDTTRPFCDHLTAKDDGYFHISEVKGFLNGVVGDKKVELDKKSKLPSGFYGNTTEENFFVLRGGYNCGHQIFPVSESSVPKSLLERIKGQNIVTKESVVDVTENKVISENEKELVYKFGKENVNFAKINENDGSIDKFEDEYKPKDGQARQKYTPEQLVALFDYQDVAYEDINSTLRGKLDINKLDDFRRNAINSSIKDLDELIDNNELKQDVILWRGYTSEEDTSDEKIRRLVGTNLPDKGFKSTSVLETVAQRFINISTNQSTKAWFLLKIIAKKGNKGVYVDKLAKSMREKEFLLKRESKFKVINVEKRVEWSLKLSKNMPLYTLTVEIV